MKELIEIYKKEANNAFLSIKTDDIEKSFELIKNDKSATSLASICRHVEPHPMKMFEKNGSYIRHLISSDKGSIPKGQQA